MTIWELIILILAISSIGYSIYTTFQKNQNEKKNKTSYSKRLSTH